ncbi:Uma2 family endonuclease [Candidatus Entotheonella palauensis]|uniref:Uma2 family endonuclease n=1 Tax=Candidatus Entotheonella palauensis TaxID=93172 RepID=UPI0015C4AD4F
MDTPTNAAGRPTHAVLIIEVTESSLTYDRDHKGPLYAAAGIGEYWLINLRERCLELYRQPVPDPASFSGWSYQDRQVLLEGDRVNPLAAPDIGRVIDRLFPSI